MQAGRLRHLVHLDKPVRVQNDTGEVVVTFQPALHIFAAVEQLSGRELEVQSQIDASVSTKITARWSPAFRQIDTTWRARYRNLVFNLQSIADLDFRNREIEMLCSSGVNNG